MGHAERSAVVVSKWRARWWWTSGHLGGAWQVARAVVVDKWPAVLFGGTTSHTGIHTYKHAYIQAGRQTVRDRQTDRRRQADRRTDGDRQIYIHTYVHTYVHTDIHT